MVGWTILAASAAEPGSAALFFDVDGTLAPIVADPEDARVPDATRAELRRLAARYGLVACVSGRTGEVARAIVGVPELDLRRRARARARPGGGGVGGADPLVRQHGRLARRGEAALGRVPLPRPRPTEAAARRQLEQIEADARAEGFRTRWGRLVLEVLPPIERPSGRQSQQLFDAPAWCGRSTPATTRPTSTPFAALDALELGVRIAIASAESPAALREAADVVLAPRPRSSSC